VLASGSLFVSGSSLIDPSWYRIVDAKAIDSSTLLSSSTREGSSFGLSRKQISEIYYPGAKRDVQAWVLKPSDFDENKKYPLAMLIHGGPQGAWLDSWSSRWNPAVFAEQGYVVVCPNPTGSTGFGQEFTDAIRKQWGGLPYEDIVKAFEYVESSFHFVDATRAVALGASYGGFMMNWIQGTPGRSGIQARTKWSTC
jgi:dipeptidyl aminopeptidase/acylaminoacyl peptidase